MKPEYLHLVNEAYQLYRDRTALTSPDSDLMKAFKRSYGIDKRDTPIQLLGVWDTVGALGIPLWWFKWFNKKYMFHDVKLSSQIKNAYHALAIDEQRNIFEPALWEVNESSINELNPQKCEQVWFPGVHSNVGGGYCDTGLSDTALLWMVEKASETGLEFKGGSVEKIKSDSCGELRNSATIIYSIIGKKQRNINSGITIRTEQETGKKTTVPVLRNESLHYTCLERRHKNNEYRPVNLTKALSLKTPYDPKIDKWDDTWRDYIKDL